MPKIPQELNIRLEGAAVVVAEATTAIKTATAALRRGDFDGRQSGRRVLDSPATQRAHATLQRMRFEHPHLHALEKGFSRVAAEFMRAEARHRARIFERAGELGLMALRDSYPEEPEARLRFDISRLAAWSDFEALERAVRCTEILYDGRTWSEERIEFAVLSLVTTAGALLAAHYGQWFDFALGLSLTCFVAFMTFGMGTRLVVSSTSVRLGRVVFVASDLETLWARRRHPKRDVWEMFAFSTRDGGVGQLSQYGYAKLKLPAGFIRAIEGLGIAVRRLDSKADWDEYARLMQAQESGSSTQQRSGF